MTRARNQLYSIPTYDAIFKLVLDQDNIRPSFFHAFIPDLHIESSIRIDDHMNPLKELQLLRDLLHEEKNNQCYNLLKGNSDFSVHLKKTDKIEPCQESTEFIRAIINQFDDLKIAFPKVEYDGTMDFVCRLDTGDNILIEMQIIPYNHWDQRALAYVAALYGRQIRKGGKWDDIKRIIGINILGGGKDQTVHWEDTPDQFVRHYKLTEQLHPDKRIMDGIEIIQYSIMNAPKTIENQETKDWLTYFQRAHLMTEKEVQETIK
ncbi:MAG: PD-(D/E)XK nuclease family transposase, partial [Chlamydiota bacterium]